MARMWTESSGIIGIGYQGRTLDEFIDGLSKWGVTALVDVRMTPISRKKGFSKTALSEALAGAGIEYLHYRDLGNPKTNRDGFWEPGTTAHREARDTYRELLAGDAAVAAVRELARRASSQKVAVLCFEEEERCCHRSLVLEEVKSRLSELAAV